MRSIEERIDTFHLEDLRNALHPSFYDVNEGYDMLIVRLPVIKERLEVVSLGFVITPESSYLYNREEQSFEEFGDRFNTVHQLLDKITDQFLRSFANYQDMIADMEEMLYADRSRHDFMTYWLGLKRDIVRIERVLLRAGTVLNELIQSYEESENFPINHYVDLHEHIDRTTRSCALQLSKLDYLYSFHSARTNEKMNSLIYTLTIISAVFLPLNLVVGFFGMNTGGLPFAEGSFGTLKAVGLMLSLLFVTSAIIFFTHKKLKKSIES